jgi:hypothetical protein
MTSPTSRDIVLKVNWSEFRQRLHCIRSILSDTPKGIWLDLRSDRDGPYLTVRAGTDHRGCTLRVPALISGTFNSFSHHCDYSDVMSSNFAGAVEIRFNLPSLEIVRENKRLLVGSPPESMNSVPFPRNGEYEIKDTYLDRIKELVRVASLLGIHASIRLRYSMGYIFVYTTDLSRTVVARIPCDSGYGVWDVEIPSSLLEEMSSGKSIIIDHMHNAGLWVTDGYSFIFNKKSSEYACNFDIPGICRVVKSFGMSIKFPELSDPAMKAPGVFLFEFSSGLMKVSKLDAEQFGLRRSFECVPVGDFPVDWRSRHGVTVLESSVIQRAVGNTLHITTWPYSPVVIDTGFVEVLASPPLLSPDRLAECISDSQSDIAESLRGWSGDESGILLESFRGGHSKIQEAASVISEKAPQHNFDALFLAKSPSGLKYVGGVSRRALGCLLVELAYSAIYPERLVREFVENKYWPDLPIFVFDPSYVEINGQDVISPWPNWTSWEKWAGVAPIQKVRPSEESLQLTAIKSAALVPPSEILESTASTSDAETPIKESGATEGG